MSLLLEALKKAERRKRERDAQSALPLGEEPRLGEGRLEISLEDDPTPNPAPGRPERGAAAGEPDAARERSGAQTLFSAKEVPARRLSAIAVTAALALLAAAIGAYYVWRETSRPVLTTFTPAPVVQASRGPAVPPPASPPARPAAAAKPPSLPAPEPVAAAPAPTNKTQASAAPDSTARGQASEKPASPAQAQATANPIKIHRGQPEVPVSSLLAAAYQALMARDLDSAQRDYTLLLQKDPVSRDALLGLAAIAVKRGQKEEAQQYYAKALELNPRDPLAVAGLLGLARQPDPSAVESRLKSLIAAEPDSEILYFSLGNQYAAQSRWGEAQQAYFQAYRSAPSNADFAFNLAIALDHLNQVKLAAQYYRRALALAEKGPASFDRSAAAARLAELGK